ncbi:MAG TPA: hypothetical protein VFO75_03735 [Candidatus Dormibacteraeota bacterium]|nr:hypothetical protein [Candidatus Dormibacteraeota bacterium]
MSAVNVLFPLGSSVVSLVFGGLVLDQWWQRRRSFQLVWAIGLLFYAVSTGAEFVGSAFGWNEPLYRAWYLTGAFLVPAYLGLGSLYLLNKTRFGYFVAASVVLGGLFSLAATAKYPGSSIGGDIALALSVVTGAAIATATAVRRELQAHVAMVCLVAGTVVVAALVTTAHLTGGYLDPATHVPVASAFPGYLRVSSVPFNAGGGLALVFGALYSAYIYMPKRRVLAARLAVIAITVNFIASLPGAMRALLQGKLNSRVPATLLIAAGAFIPGVTSSLDRFGITWALLLGQLLGVLLIFGGFLVSEEVFKNVRVGFTLWARHEVKPAEG